MSDSTWQPAFLESLRDLADENAQRKAWVELDSPDFPAAKELICQVFDDSAIDDLLVNGHVFSPEGDRLLGELSRAVDGFSVPVDLGRLLQDKKWLEIVDLAGRAFSEINGSRGKTARRDQ